MPSFATSRAGLSTALLLAAAALTACSQAPADGGDGGPRLAIGVAPLALPGVSDACYELAVFAGSDPATAPLVWSRADVCASRFGDDQGSLAYVGTCDASGDGTNTVRLVVEDLCQGGDCGPTYPGPNSLAASDWVNPCPSPDGCTLTTTCRENADVPVTFRLVVARSANQGFFDVAVSFSDIFCSAKLDCQNASGAPLELLFDPDTGERGPTVVVAWACTGGPDADTYLYYDNLAISCFDAQNQPLGTWPYDPSLGPGNAGPGAAPFVFETGVYRTKQDDGDVSSWNVAFGIDPLALPGRCVLTARATASDGRLDNDTTPDGAVYPYIEWNVELSAAAGALSCSKHALNVPGSGVTTAYSVAGPVAFSHALQTSAMRVSSLERQACSATIASLDGQVSFALAPEGLTARVGGEQSPFYPLPEGLSLQGCCGDPCCGAPAVP